MRASLIAVLPVEHHVLTLLLRTGLGRCFGLRVQLVLVVLLAVLVHVHGVAGCELPTVVMVEPPFAHDVFSSLMVIGGPQVSDGCSRVATVTSPLSHISIITVR